MSFRGGENVVQHRARGWHLEELMRDKKFGTVGAVACDQDGNIAAATSTGGMTNKKYGRIWDSPLIGSGTYANNKTCAISCTGHGEPFIRAVAAHDVSCLMEYKGYSLDEAMIFNSAGMYRAMRNSDGMAEVAIYK